MRACMSFGVWLVVGCVTLTACVKPTELVKKFDNPLSTDASMRVEVEVYKGPLSKTIPVQWGELKGLAEEARLALKTFKKNLVKAAKARRYLEGNKCEVKCETCPDPFSTSFIGCRILRTIKKDAEDLLAVLDEVEKSIELHSLGKLKCQIDQALAGLGKPPAGHCGQAPVKQASLEKTRARLAAASQTADAVTAQHKKVRAAAKSSITQVGIAKKKTVSARENLPRRKPLTDAKASAESLRTQLAKVTDRFVEGLEVIRTAKNNLDLANNPHAKATDLRGPLSEAATALQRLEELTALEKVRTELYGTTLKLIDAVNEIDSPAATLIAQEAEALSQRIAEGMKLRIGLAPPEPSAATDCRTVKPSAEVENAKARCRATRWSWHLDSTLKTVHDQRAEVSRLRDAVTRQVTNGLNILLAQVDAGQKTLDSALDALEVAERKTKELSKLAADDPNELPDRGQIEQVAEQVGRVAAKLRATAFQWAEVHTALAPQDRWVRTIMAGFSNLCSELSNQLGSRADALQRQIGEKVDAKSFPLSIYLRDAEPTDFLNLYTWNRATAWALLEEMFWHPLNAFSSNETADRVRVIERLFADHNWGKINTVYGSGQGNFTMALVKDDVGNWNLKSFDSDPTDLLTAYTQLTLTAIDAARNALPGGAAANLLQVAGTLTRGQIGQDSEQSGLSNTGGLHGRVVDQLRTIGANATKRKGELNKRYDDTRVKADSSAIEARTAKDEAVSSERQAAPLTCGPDATQPCDVESTMMRVDAAREQAAKAEIGVEKLPMGVAGDAVMATAELVKKARHHAREADGKLHAATSAPVPAATNTADESAETPEQRAAANTRAARRSAERAEEYATAANAWAAHAEAIVERERVRVAFAEHRATVTAQIRNVLKDYVATIAALQEVLIPSRSSTNDTPRAEIDQMEP